MKKNPKNEKPNLKPKTLGLPLFTLSGKNPGEKKSWYVIDLHAIIRVVPGILHRPRWRGVKLSHMPVWLLRVPKIVDVFACSFSFFFVLVSPPEIYLVVLLLRAIGEKRNPSVSWFYVAGCRYFCPYHNTTGGILNLLDTNTTVRVPSIIVFCAAIGGFMVYFCDRQRTANQLFYHVYGFWY